MITKIYSTPAHQQPCLLSPEDLAAPEEVIKDHFEKYHLAENRQLLWTILSAAISGDIDNFYDASDVGQWVIYLRELEELLEAVWITQNK